MLPVYTKILRFLLLGLGTFLGLRLLGPVMLPFFLGWLLALSAEPAVRWMHGRLRFPRALASALGVGGVFLLFTTLVVLVLAGLLRQIPRLMGLLPQLESAVLSGKALLEGWLMEIAAKFPGAVGTLMQGWTRGLFSGGEQLVAPLLQRLPGMITGIAGKMSKGLFGAVTALIASFMLSARLPQLGQIVQRYLPEGFLPRLGTAGRRLKGALGGWCLAQGKLAGITFFVLAAGFFLLRVRNPLVLAAVVAVVDAFPVLGVGTVLCPWSLMCFLQGETVKAVGLLSTFAVVWLLRSVLEPKLVGSSIGLDPLLTLGAIYAGFKLGGILGMLLAPILAMTAMQLWQAWK